MFEALKRPTRANAYLFLTLTMLFWAGNYTIGRWAAGHVPPVTLAFLGEQPQLYHLTGVALILAGVGLAARHS